MHITKQLACPKPFLLDNPILSKARGEGSFPARTKKKPPEMEVVAQ